MYLLHIASQQHMLLDSEITIIKQVEIPEAFISIRSDGIVPVHYKKNTVLDVDLQMRCLDIYAEILDRKKMKFIFSADDGFMLTKEARENAPKVQVRSPILYYAIIANNLAYKIIANFYIKVMKPAGNYKIFNTVEAGVKWLHSFKDEDSKL